VSCVKNNTINTCQQVVSITVEIITGRQSNWHISVLAAQAAGHVGRIRQPPGRRLELTTVLTYCQPAHFLWPTKSTHRSTEYLLQYEIRNAPWNYNRPITRLEDGGRSLNRLDWKVNTKEWLDKPRHQETILGRLTLCHRSIEEFYFRHQN